MALAFLPSTALGQRQIDWDKVQVKPQKLGAPSLKERGPVVMILAARNIQAEAIQGGCNVGHPTGCGKRPFCAGRGISAPEIQLVEALFSGRARGNRRYCRLFKAHSSPAGRRGSLRERLSNRRPSVMCDSSSTPSAPCTG